MKKFYELVQEIQTKNIGYINLIQNGIFFQAIGKDAVKIMHIFELKPICFKANVCKCVIPSCAIKSYIKKIVEEKYACILYSYDKKENKLKELLKVEGNKVDSIKECQYCEKCWYKEKRDKNNIVNVIEEINKFKKDLMENNNHE